jgi:hypothetical protein
MAEEILIGVRLDRQEGEREIDSLTQSIVELNKANKELTESNKTLAKTGQENSKEYKDNARQIEINKQKITENTASRKGLVQAIVAEEGSLKQLRIENQMLIKQRDSINIKTDEGKKKIQELNAQIDRNNEVIKENSSKLEQQKLNIGNYAGAIDKLIPGFAQLQSSVTAAISGIKSATTAYQGLTLAQRAFLLPLTAIIAAIALVVSYFTRTEAGADKLARVMAQLGAIIDVLADRAASLGKAIVSLFSGDFIGAANAAKEAVSGLGDELQREVEEAGKLADILDELEDRERSYAVAASITTLEIKRLIVQAKNRNLTEQERIDLLDKATKLELKSNKELLKLREDDLDAAIRSIKQTTEGAKMEQKLNESRLDFAKRIIENEEIQGAEKDKLAEKIKAYNEAEGQSLVLQEALQNKRDALAE